MYIDGSHGGLVQCLILATNTPTSVISGVIEAFPRLLLCMDLHLAGESVSEDVQASEGVLPLWKQKRQRFKTF